MDEVSTANFGPPFATSLSESATVRAWTFRSGAAIAPLTHPCGRSGWRSQNLSCSSSRWFVYQVRAARRGHPLEKFGRRWRQRTFGPRRRHIPIAQTDIISGCISDPKGVRRSGGAIWRYCNSGLAAVMQRASPRGVHPQCICTERKRPSWMPG